MGSAILSLHMLGSEHWGGDYADLWFDSDAWSVRCTNPDGGKVHLYDGDSVGLSCTPMIPTGSPYNY